MRISENFIGSYPFVRIDGVSELDIEKIFDCGQCFRFERVENSQHESEFSGVAYGRFVSFAQDGDTLYIYGSDLADFEAVWRGYLDLDRDYREVERDVLAHSQNSALIAAIEYGRGIRILSNLFGIRDVVRFAVLLFFGVFHCLFFNFDGKNRIKSKLGNSPVGEDQSPWQD